MTDLNKLTIGSVVSIMAKGKRVDCAISNVRYIRRGKNAGKREYTLAPFVKQGKTYAWTVRGETLLGIPKGTYTQEQINAAIGKEGDTRQEIAERKAERTQKGREAIGDIDYQRSEFWRGAVSGTKIGIGDEVLVKYRDGSKWETVAKVNFKTGKIGIEKHRDNDLEMLMDMAAAVRGKTRRSSNIRWIHPEHIIQTRQPEKKLPASIGDRALETLCDKGWAQMTFGREFIEQSYVVAFEKEGARKGQTYECADTVIYFDPDLKVYWRSTGCFD